MADHVPGFKDGADDRRSSPLIVSFGNVRYRVERRGPVASIAREGESPIELPIELIEMLPELSTCPGLPNPDFLAASSGSRVGSVWSEAEEAHLDLMFNSGWSIREMALRLRRTQVVVRHRLVQMGRIPPRRMYYPGQIELFASGNSGDTPPAATGLVVGGDRV